MDPKRLKYLQQLAGLKLSVAERTLLQKDLTAIEATASFLLDRPVAEDFQDDFLAPDPGAGLPEREMDDGQVVANAPDFADDFFRVPAVDTSGEGQEP